MIDATTSTESSSTPDLPESPSTSPMVELTRAELEMVSGGLDGSSKDAAY